MPFLAADRLKRAIELTHDTQSELFTILQDSLENVADPALREAANDAYGTDDIEIDDEPATSEADNGVWVAAWVWIANVEESEDE